MEERIQKNKLIWNSMLSFVVLALFLGNLNHTIKADEVENGQLYKQLSIVPIEKRIENRKIETSIVNLFDNSQNPNS